MHPAFRDAGEQANVDDTGVFRWKDTGRVVGDVSLRKIGITDPDLLRVNEIARLDEFLAEHSLTTEEE